MIEQSLFQSNFLGRDGFKWWIGQVANPETSGWSKTATLVEKDDCQYYRVKVRILGYHPTREKLADKDLPFAHVLVPLNDGSGVNQIGETHQIQGGESVLGFFADGDDCQQPIIMGSFYRQKSQLDETFAEGEEVTWKRFSGPRNTSEYQSQHRSGISTVSLGGVNVATGTSSISSPPNAQPPGVVDDISKALASHAAVSSDPITPPNPCENNQISRIRTFLLQFMKRMKQIQGFLNSYVDPVFNRLVNLDSEIKGFAKMILGVASGLIQKAREYILSYTGTAIHTSLASLFPKSLQPVSSAASRTILDLIFCLFERLLNLLFDWIVDLLTGLLGRLFDIVQCVVDDFLNDLFSQISDFIDENISPILSQLNSLIGGALGNVSNIISQSLSYAGIILNFIGNCDATECPIPSTWSPSGGVNFDFLDDFSTLVSQLGGSDFGPCDTSLICSTTISITGGGGAGAQANPIVVGGQIIGVDLIDGGYGYITLPSVYVEDNCGGYGAELVPIINDGGEVIDVIINDPGNDYTDNGVRTSSGIFMGDISGDTSENGTRATFKVCLLTEPRYDVSVGIVSEDESEGNVDLSELIFTRTNWNIKQTVTVTGVDDLQRDGDVSYSIRALSSSRDTRYQSKLSRIVITNLDNETGIGTEGADGGDTGGIGIGTGGTGTGGLTNPPGTTPTDPVSPTTKCGFIAGVNIRTPGYDYDPQKDTVSVYDCSGNLVPEVKIDLVFGPGNSIIGAEIRQSAVFCECLPVITINTRTGSGATLIASMRYTGITPKDPEIIQKISIIDCISK